MEMETISDPSKSTASVSPPAAIACGFLLRKSLEGLSIWKKVYCQMNNYTLEIWNAMNVSSTEKEILPKESCIDSIHLLNRRITPIDGFFPFQFALTCSSSGSAQECLEIPTEIFRAESREEYEKWIQAFTFLMEGNGSEKDHEKDSRLPFSSSFFNMTSIPKLIPSIAGTSASSPSCSLCSQLIQTNFRKRKILHILLIRHGHYIHANDPEISDENRILSEMGRQQAERCGEYILNVGFKKRHPSGIVLAHSDLTRAKETAFLIHEKFQSFSIKSNLQASRLLREGWPGNPYPNTTPFTNSYKNRVHRNPSSAFLTPNETSNHKSTSTSNACSFHSSSNSSFQPFSSEEQEREMKRLDACFRLFFTQHSDEPDEGYRLLICHANLIRYFICRVLQIQSTGIWGQMEIFHCSVTQIDVYEDGNMKLISMNETGHLPENLKTSSADHL